MYTAKRYARELDEDCDDVTQAMNTCKKVITLAQIQERDESTSGDGERVPERLRAKQRALIHRMGVPERIYRNIDYHSKKEIVVRSGLEALAILSQTEDIVDMIRLAGYRDERLFYRRLNRIPGPELGMYLPKKKTGLSGMVEFSKNGLQFAVENMDGDEDSDEMLTDEKKEFEKQKSVVEIEDAKELCRTQGYFPELPVKIQVWTYRFRHNDHVQQCAARISDAFRGLYHPDKTLRFIQSQIKRKYNLPEELKGADLTAVQNREYSRISRKANKGPKTKLVKKGNKYIVEVDAQKPAEKKKKYGLPLAKGEKIECKFAEWWPRYYAGVILKAEPNPPSSSSEGGIYVVGLDDGEVISNVELYMLRNPQQPKFDGIEHLKSLLRILSSQQYMVHPHLAETSAYTLFLLLSTGNQECGPHVAIQLGCLDALLMVMRMHPVHAPVQIRCCHALDAICRHCLECCKEVAKTGVIRDLMDNLKGIKFENDERGTLDAQKSALWCIDALVEVRGHVEEMEAHGGQYILTAAKLQQDLVMTRKLKLVDWKKLRDKRLIGGDEDELQQLEFLKKLFVPCVHMMHVGKGECNDLRHCRDCFLNFHAQGFWHKIGCAKHPDRNLEEDPIPTLLEMTQLRRAMESFDPNPPAKKPETALMDYTSTKLEKSPNRGNVTTE
jgi:hypothetical protein